MTVVNPKSISGINSITTGSGSDNLLTIHNNGGAERFRIDGSGNTRITSGIVTTVSVGAVTGDISIDDKIVHTGDTNTAIRFPAADTFTVETSGSEALRVDSSGRLNIGNTSHRTVWGGNTTLQIEGLDGAASSATIVRNSNDVWYPWLGFGKSRGTSDGSSTIVQANDCLGVISWNGADGTDMNPQAAAIYCDVDGTPGNNDMPGRLEFHTTADGAESSTERMRINSVGKVGINSTAPDGMLAIEHTSSAPNLTMRNHPAAGPYTNEYGMELRHAYGSVKHGALIHTEEAADGRRSLDVSDSNGVFATFANGKVGINTYTPNNMLHINGLNGSACIKMDDNGQPNRYGKIFNYAEGIHLQARNNTNKGNVVFRGEDAGATIYYGRFTENGLCFGSDSAAANALDDYEEGTFTPSYKANSVNPTVGYINQDGVYTKIGKVVYFQIYMRVNSWSGGSGALYLDSLPFNSTNTGGYGGSSGVLYVHSWGGDRITSCMVSANSSNLYLYKGISSGTSVNAYSADVGSSSQLRINGMYHTSA